MEHSKNHWSVQRILLSYGIGMVVVLGVLLVGAFLLEKGTLPQSLLPGLGGVSLFVGVTLGGVLLSKSMHRKLLVTLGYSGGWGLLLLLIKVLCWNQAAMGNWWIWLILFCSALVGAWLASCKRKKKY